MHELADPLFDRDMAPEPRTETTGLGRNVTVFDELRVFAYSEVLKFRRAGERFEAWRSRVAIVADGINKQFPLPMRPAEVRGIVKSVSEWTWKHFSLEKFSARQLACVNQRWKDHVAASKTKPWEALGISRATYYRRKKAASSDEFETYAPNPGIMTINVRLYLINIETGSGLVGSAEPARAEPQS
jgi:hypothetical protein